MRHLLLTGAMLLSAGSMMAWTNSVDTPMPVFPTGTNNYGVEVKLCPDGTSWAVMYYPNLKNADSEEDISNVVYEYRLQHFDSDGNPTFDPMGILVSDYNNLSYTVINQYLLTDADGNAIVAVADSRYSAGKERSYTAYKVSPTGQMLWGEDGVPVSDPLKPCTLSAAMSMVELDDHSIVFAWHEYTGQEMTAHLHMQRITSDGKAQWDPNTAGVTDVVAGYPHLVPSGDNTFVMVYARTASNILYARKMDFEAESVWGKDVRIYRGGWGSAPLQIYFDVAPSGDGGALVCWYDDRENTGTESAHLSYVTPEGKLGFAGASDEADVKLSYAGWRNFNVACCPAADGSGFYAVWRATNDEQHFQGVQAQKVSKKGELLWGDEALYVEDVEINKSYGYISAQSAPNGDLMPFYEEYRAWFDQQGYVNRYDKDGKAVWADGKKNVTAANRGAAQLQSIPVPGKASWVCVWKDGGTSETDKDETTCMALVNDDGTIGIPGNEPTALCYITADRGLTLRNSALMANVADGTMARISNAAGMVVDSVRFADGKASLRLPSGLYIATLPNGGVLKFQVK